MIYVAPGTTFEATFDQAPTGLTGTLGVRIEDGQGTTVTPRATTGIVEHPAGSGIYTATLTAPVTAGQYVAVADTGGSTPVYATEQVTVTSTLPTVTINTAPGPEYTTPDLLRAQLGVDATVLPDDQAMTVIATAEDLIDQALGARWVDETTGRKIVQADVDAWRWGKLSRATTKLAARLYTTPELLDRQYMTVSGPDFSVSGPVGSRILTPEIDALLNASGLRRPGGRARSGHAGRGRWGVLLDDGTWDDEPVWSGGGRGAFG